MEKIAENFYWLHAHTEKTKERYVIKADDLEKAIVESARLGRKLKNLGLFDFFVLETPTGAKLPEIQGVIDGLENVT